MSKFSRLPSRLAPRLVLAVLCALLVAWYNTSLAQGTGQALLTAAEAGDQKAVERLLRDQADVNAKRPGEGSTALMLACNKGHAKDVKVLLENGADANIRNVNGWTALMSAAANGNVEIVGLLLQRNADTKAKHAYGWTALKLASKKGHNKVRELLIKHEQKRARDRTHKIDR